MKLDEDPSEQRTLKLHFQLSKDDFLMIWSNSELQVMQVRMSKPVKGEKRRSNSQEK